LYLLKRETTEEPEVPGTDDAKLQGTWIVDEKGKKPRTLVVTGNKIFMKDMFEGAGTLGTGTFMLDPTAKPKAIDIITMNKEKALGIYEVNGDTLKICLVLSPTPTRPKAFSEKDLILKRIKNTEKLKTYKDDGEVNLQKGEVKKAIDEVAVKRAALQVAEGQKKVAIAKLTAIRSQVAEAKASESLAEKQVKRFEELYEANAVGQNVLIEKLAQWEADKARRKAAEEKVVECEAQVQLEEARVRLARVELENAELRLKRLKGSHESKR
jgi:uncharacterized protein (TIGR03067 family)